LQSTENGRVIAWNRANEEMTGLLKAETIGKGNYDYSAPFYGKNRPILIDLIFMDRKVIEDKYYFVLRKGDQLIAETFIPKQFEEDLNKTICNWKLPASMPGRLRK
jgi:PAS domain-containing protein